MSVLAPDRPAVSLAALAPALAAAWTRRTSADPSRWSSDNPAWGQCAVSALVVQDHLGGHLLRGTVEETSHYWNLLPDGSDVDLTLQQFEGTATPAEIETREREYVLSSPDTRQRYEWLRAAVDRLVGDHA